MSIEFTNNASGSLRADIAGVAPGPEDTVLPLQTNEAQLFPSVTTSSGDFFYVTLEDSAGNIEICKCTNRDTITDNLTVQRAQENTTSQNFAAGTKVECRPTAGTFNEFLQKGGGAMTGPLDMAGQQLINPVVTTTGTASIRGIPIRGGDNGTSNEFIVPSAGGSPTIGGNIVTHAGNDAAYVKTSRAINNGQGITGGGSLASDLTIGLNVNALAQINGNAITTGDAFLVHDGDVNQHKRVLYENGGIPIVTKPNTAHTAQTSDLNKFLRFTNSSPVTYTLDDNLGITGNIIIIEQTTATGQVTIAGSAQVNSAFTLSTRTENSVAVLVCVQGGAVAIWTLYGDLAE
jgi:hypothetical protein